MNSVTFECEIITPMFLAGADGKTPELRPPSIKGIMRFWWRAIKGENNPETLRIEDILLFGGSDEKIGRSKCSLRILNKTFNKGFINQKPLPHHTGDSKCTFLPSCKSKNNNNKCNKGFEIPSIANHSQFKIELKSLNMVQQNYFSNILQLSLILGGLGKRSRRGFGSVHCKSWNFTNNNELVQFILSKLNAIQNDFDVKDMEIYRNSSSGANYPFIKEIALGKPEKDPFDLLKKIGQASHLFNDPSLGYAGKFNNNTIRMASPIYVTIAKIGNEFIPIITTLNSAFPPSYPFYDLQKQQQFRGSL
ncbi:MAG: type III-B CRISPR module RAMP protein Cmr1 [wastewater metagenome]|nr:type III-B CRISPR module RAMP protein Cmr1 [Candidatus Loosdrechtia aerotolerans]